MPSETIESFLEIAIWITISGIIISLSFNIQNFYHSFILKSNVEQLMEVLINRINCAFLTRSSIKITLPRDISNKDFRIVISNSKINFFIENELFIQYSSKIILSNNELLPGMKYIFSYDPEINGIIILKCD
ncbi:MAG: hypothetical protein QXF09_02055 [Nitrososphaerota archaeon]